MRELLLILVVATHRDGQYTVGVWLPAVSPGHREVVNNSVLILVGSHDISDPLLISVGSAEL